MTVMHEAVDTLAMQEDRLRDLGETIVESSATVEEKCDMLIDLLKQKENIWRQRRNMAGVA